MKISWKDLSIALRRNLETLDILLEADEFGVIKNLDAKIESVERRYQQRRFLARMMRSGVN